MKLLFAMSAAVILVTVSACIPQQADHPGKSPATVSSTGSAAGETPVTATAIPDAPDDAPVIELEEGFQPLSLADFEIFYSKPAGAAPVWTAAGNGFNCSGKPRGYLYSKEEFADYTLRLDFRFPRPAELKDDAEFLGNTGIMIHINGEHRQWPVSLEVQGKHPEMGTIKANGGAATVTIVDQPEVRQRLRRGPGEWNRIEVISRGGALTALLNGEKVCESQPGELKGGRIGFQSEDFPVQFRNIRIRRDAEAESQTADQS